MNRLILTFAAIAGVGMSGPAVAQGYGYGPYGPAYAQQGYAGASQQLHGRIQHGMQRGLIDRREAQYLFGKLSQLAEAEQRLAYRGYGYTGDRTVRVRARALQRAIQKAEQSPAWGYRRW
jgi:hypothetical protein